MKLPKISIVIPSYNKVDYIEETLRSIVDQEYSNLEVIIQDGGSVDGTLDIIKSYVKKYPRLFSFVSEKDKGQTDAINKGLRKAKGEVVTYLNADDTYQRGALKKVGEQFAKSPEAVWLAGQGNTIDSQGKKISFLVSKYKNFLLRLNNISFLLVVNYLMQPSVFLSMKAYKKYGPFTGWEGGVLEYALWLKIAKDRMPIVLDIDLSNFRISKDSISSTKYPELLEKDYQIAKKYTKNPVVLLLHSLHNMGRVSTLKSLGMGKVT